MTTSLVLYDDERARSFEPLTNTRPASELLAGIATIRERWEEVLQIRSDGFVSRRDLVEFEEEQGGSCFASPVPVGCIIANSRFVASLPDPRENETMTAADADVWVSAGRVAAVRVRDGIAAQDLADGRMRLDKIIASGHRTANINGIWLENVWDFIRFLPSLLTSDIAGIHAGGLSAHKRLQHLPDEVVRPMRLRELAALLGDNPVIVAADATIDPHVVLDGRNGPILICAGATIHSFTRIEGPCLIGPHSTVMAGRISSCAIGPRCKVSGEMSNSIVLGYANKAHDGFVGHSYLGRWVNIGAGTITSNLKNTYGDVSLWTPSGVQQTGMQFLGSFFGDHARTGIGTMLATGSVLGAGANVFGGVMPPRYVPPFSWGSGNDLGAFQFEKFLEVAGRVMSRRNVALSDRMRRHYYEVHQKARGSGT